MSKLIKILVGLCGLAFLLLSAYLNRALPIDTDGSPV